VYGKELERPLSVVAAADASAFEDRRLGVACT
jgi:hypothetical protein